MDIKEVEHHAVYSKKQKSLLLKYKKEIDIFIINLCKKYKKISNKVFKHYDTCLNKQNNYFNKFKKKKRKYLKLLRSSGRKDTRRFRALLRSDPFPAFFSNYFKNLKDIFKQVKIKKPKKPFILSYNRIFKINRIYDKLNNKYYYNNYGKLNKIKKKKKKFKLKFNLWNSLIYVNYNKVVNYINKALINMDDQLNFLPIIQTNYMLKIKNKINIKYNNNIYTIFKQYKKGFFKNFFKLNIINKIILYYNANLNDNFIYIFSNLKKLIYNTFYNKFFIINYNFNYFNSFYNILRYNLLNNMLFKIKLKNYYNFLILFKKKKNFIVNINVIKINNNKKKNLNNMYNKIYKSVKKVTMDLIKKKKFTKHSIAKINVLFLKKLVANNTKLNMFINDKIKLYNNTSKVNYNIFSTYFKELQKPIKIKRYDFYFYKFVKKNLVLQKNILKKYQKYSFYIAKKYHFLISFIKYYFSQLFYCLKFAFYNDVNNFSKFLLKLKLLFIYIYYTIFIRFTKPFITKKKQKLIYSNKFFTYNIIAIYKKAMKKFFSKKRKEWLIKRKKIKDIDKITQPWHLFRYNPLLNSKHNLWVTRKKQKQKKILGIIKKKARSYLTWYKWESRRQFYKKHRFSSFKKWQYKKRFKKKLVKLKGLLKLKLIKFKLKKKFKKIFKKMNIPENVKPFIKLSKFRKKIYNVNVNVNLMSELKKKKKKVSPFFYQKEKRKWNKFISKFNNIKNNKSKNFYKKKFNLK